MIPASGLCPIWGAPGESLSPGAAASFSAMSKAYAAQTGVPLCITDSYRSLPDQISIKVKRGRFAATPGTSHHGLGRAVDLCGGVQDFGSPAHQWMRQNAPLYGWFHPDWAEPTGALPEPWHWEYAG
jgi:LAS superfamily LD-carboxypeptidase LdcB